MPTTLQHTDRALAVARETGWDIDAAAIDHEWSGVGVGPVGRHRDSDALERSNYATVLADLQSTCGDAIGEASFGHWGVGWVEEIIFDAGNPEAVAAVGSWRDALESYPVADEEAYSMLEHEEMLEYCATLNLECERDSIEYVTNPAVSDMPGELASLIFETQSATRADDVREERLTDDAIAASLLIPDADDVRAQLAALEADAETLRDAIRDFDRGILTHAELLERAA